MDHTPIALGNVNQGGTVISPRANASDLRRIYKKVRRVAAKSSGADLENLKRFRGFLVSIDAAGPAPHIVTPEGDRVPVTPAVSTHEPGVTKRTGRPRRAEGPRAPAWREVGEITRATFYHYALVSRGAVYDVSLHLSSEVLALSAAHPSSDSNYIRRRLSRYLENKLDLEVWFWFALEQSDGGEEGGWHLHGEISAGARLSSREERCVRNALKGAAGRWAGPSANYQLKMRLYPDKRWARYSAKNAHLAAMPIRNAVRRGLLSQRFAVSFDGRALIASRPVKARAAQIYGVMRGHLLRGLS